MTLKQAILALPKIDKRWRHGGTLGSESYYYYKRKSHKEGATISTAGNSIETYHAAAKSIGIEINWITKYIPLIGFVYYPCFIALGKIEYTGTTYFKTPLRAICAAFIAAVEYRLKEGK